jgi:hypothetical protein
MIHLSVNERGFVYDPSGKIWLPPINPKQAEVFSDYHRYLLVHGPRKSSKTWGICHKIVRHAFEVRGATFGIVTKTIKNAKASGVWTLLSNVMLPFWERGIPPEQWEPWMPEMWKQGCPGFKVIEGPKTTGDTKMSFVKIQNRHGTISEIQCHSLEHASEVEAKFKGPFYSGFWLSEFDQYCDRHAFDIFCDALRMPGVPYEQHQIICDCNPPESGTNNWMHDLWFKFKDNPPEADESDSERRFREEVHRVLVMIEDNPQLDQRERDDLYARYKKRVTLLNRFLKGIWEQDVTDGFFSDVWDEGIHVLGTTDGPPENHEMLIPTAGCRVLLGGWDAGLSKNHSFHIIEKIMNEVPYVDERTGRKFMRQLVSFSVIDEVVVVRTYLSVREFTEMCLERIIFWNKWQLNHHGISMKWRHWSDSDALDPRAVSDMSAAAVVFEASNGQITLDGAPKYQKSKRDRVQLVWQLLYEKRLHVSAQLLKTRLMFANLRQGTGADYIKKGDHAHPFDSMSYPISAEAPLDMIKSAELTTASKPTAGLVVAGV